MFWFCVIKGFGCEQKNRKFRDRSKGRSCYGPKFMQNDDSVCGCAYGIAKELFHNPELNALFQKMAKFDIRRFLHDFMEETGERISVLREAQVVETWAHKIEKSNMPWSNIKAPKFATKLKLKLKEIGVRNISIKTVCIKQIFT